jgi:hypothetical protein
MTWIIGWANDQQPQKFQTSFCVGLIKVGKADISISEYSEYAKTAASGETVVQHKVKIYVA